MVLSRLRKKISLGTELSFLLGLQTGYRLLVAFQLFENTKINVTALANYKSVLGLILVSLSTRVKTNPLREKVSEQYQLHSPLQSRGNSNFTLENDCVLNKSLTKQQEVS